MRKYLFLGEIYLFLFLYVGYLYPTDLSSLTLTEPLNKNLQTKEDSSIEDTEKLESKKELNLWKYRQMGYIYIGERKFDKAYFSLKHYAENAPFPNLMDKITLDLLRFKLGLHEEFKNNFEDNIREFRNRLPSYINKVRFCSKVISFGRYKEIESIKPGKPVLIYCEIRNLYTRKMKKKYIVDFKIEAKITTPLGALMLEDKDFFSSVHISESYCTDIFITQKIVMPKKLLPGKKYILHLFLEDRNKGTKSPTSITFIVGKSGGKDDKSGN